MQTFSVVNIRKAAVTACTCAIAAAASLAQATEASTSDGSKADQDLQEVVIQADRAVTATKTDTPLIEIPQSITVVTSQQIRDQGALVLRTALQYTAGVTNNGDDTRGDFDYTRGFWAVNYLDGLKREFGFVYLPRTEVYALERADVLLGPSAVLYGAGSSGGLVNMQSKRPQFKSSAEVTANYGTFDRKQLQFDLTTPLSDTVAVRLTALYRNSDMLLNYQPDDRKLVQASVTWRPDDRTNLTLIGNWQQDVTGPTAYMPLAATLYAPPGRRMDRSTLLGEPDFNHGPKEDKWLTLLLNHDFSESVKFRSATRIQADHTLYREIYGVYWANPLDPFLDVGKNVIPRALFALDAQYNSFDSDNSLEINFRTGALSHKVLAGVDYSRFQQLSTQAYQGATPLDIYNPVYGTANVPVWGPETRQVLTSIGFYGQDQIKLADRGSLVLGVRRDHVKADNTGAATEVDNATTLRAALTVDVTKGLAPYVSYSENFQPVSGLSQFGTHFRPLTSKQYEGGIKWQPVQAAMLRVAYYNIVESNHLVPDPNNPLDSIQGGEVTSKGFELQANYNVAHDISLSLAYAHNSTRVTGQNHQQDNSPEDTTSAFATKNLRLRDSVVLRLGGGVRYVGGQVSGDATYFQVATPSYTLVDGMAALDFHDWTLQLNAVNLLDKYYYAACDQYGSCENGDARTFNLALTRHF